ncbi:hypothetical protein ACFPFP_32225 [Bradyrhizobium sp. GCM10023182]|uniref:Transketolase-like pyrimidine-binding domain-containing protein n=1 Tax=Bradyrhizobium zhengyangense TaxID=2911009 RepID=A0ABS9LY64_9BRAD|nr:hypothetical protein [Bradyrhizobium zhengyangense]MCG2671607.1 hypothetical protein [Bradyrhizobium zhengyangense]
MRTTFIETLSQAASENPDIWLLCGDLGYSALEPFAAKFPERYLGVAEQNLAGIAAGIALSGKTVFIYSIGNFPTLRCLEQLRYDVCYHGADVKVVAVGAGYAYGSQGYTHRALEGAGIMSMLPGTEVFVPCDVGETSLPPIMAIRNSGYCRHSGGGLIADDLHQRLQVATARDVSLSSPIRHFHPAARFGPTGSAVLRPASQACP